MSTIIAGRFDTFARAETTATRLMAKGVKQDDLNMFYVNPAGQHAAYPIGGDHAADRLRENPARALAVER